MQLFKGLSINKYKSNAKDKIEEHINKNLDHEIDFISSEMERIYLTLIILDLYILRCLIFMKYTLEYIVC